MPYVEDYTEHEYGDAHFDESQESNGDGDENFDDGWYGDDNEVNGDYQQHGRTNGHHEPNGNQDNGDDGARWPHADKSNADLDMLVDYVISKAIELGVVSDSEADDSDEHDDLPVPNCKTVTICMLIFAGCLLGVPTSSPRTFVSLMVLIKEQQSNESQEAEADEEDVARPGLLSV